MSDKLYDALMIIAQVVLPALATLYISLAGIWGWGYVEQVGGSIVALDTCLGAFLKYQKTKYDASTDVE